MLWMIVYAFIDSHKNSFAGQDQTRYVSQAACEAAIPGVFRDLQKMMHQRDPLNIKAMDCVSYETMPPPLGKFPQ